jgi:esterase/lipase
MTAGARAELEWAQHAIAADCERIERPVLFVLSGGDEVINTTLAAEFAANLGKSAQVQWYNESSHDFTLRDDVVRGVIEFLSASNSFGSIQNND